MPLHHPDQRARVQHSPEKKPMEASTLHKTEQNKFHLVVYLTSGPGYLLPLFLFIMAATGPMWSFGGYRSFISGIFTSPEQGNGRMGQGQGNQYRHGQNADPTQQANISPAIAWTAALQAIRQDSPRFSKITFQDNKALVQTKANAHPRACDTYTFDESGHITSVQYYKDLAARSKVMQYAYIIHTGKWGGFVTKLLYFLACIGVHT